MRKKGKHKRIVYILIWIVLMLVLAVGFQVVNNIITKAGADEEHSSYEKHYALITNGEDETFWNSVYESALEEGKKSNVYVEHFGENLAVDYSRNELLSMAIQASVDGIIVEADDDEDTVALIDEAVDAGIPVITVINDSTTSERQAFVGINSYSVGQQYGEELSTLIEASDVPAEDVTAAPMEKNVLVLSNFSTEESGMTQILMGIRETVATALPDDLINIENSSPNSTDSFAMEEYLRTLFLDDENLPDYLVCLDSRTTSQAYQAAVDYNRVGDIQILGYYDSDTILSAVQDGIITCTLSVNTKNLGKLCVDALTDYEEYGYINNYMVVDFEMVDADEAALRLQKEEAADE